MNIDRNLRSRILMTLPIAALAVCLAGCAGGPGGGSDRPSTEELSTGITTILEDAGQGGVLTEEQVDCIAGEFLDSDVADHDLRTRPAAKTCRPLRRRRTW